MQQILFDLDGGAGCSSGERYSINMRYLRQQILVARERRLPPHFTVTMPVPEQPALAVDAFMRVDNLYIFGLQNRQGVFYFNDTAGLKLIGNQRLFGFGGHYNDLGSYADLAINRGTIAAALNQIAHWRRDQEISNRRKDRIGVPQQTGEARHLLLLILMISEAARFFDIERTVANALDGLDNTPLDPPGIQRLTHEWGYLSSQGDFQQVAIRNV
jgi:hypothetical protein